MKNYALIASLSFLLGSAGCTAAHTPNTPQQTRPAYDSSIDLLFQRAETLKSVMHDAGKECRDYLRQKGGKGVYTNIDTGIITDEQKGIGAYISLSNEQGMRFKITRYQSGLIEAIDKQDIVLAREMMSNTMNALDRCLEEFI